jgi:dethiobiotin synthetase
VRRYFVTGTDTGVGKTFVGCTLVRRFRALYPDKRAFAYKPVETGLPDVEELGDDQRALFEAAGGWQRGAACGTYRFEQPAAPAVAARTAGVTIDLDRIDRVLAAGAEGCDLVVVEGAGGLRVPMTDEVDMAGMAKRVGGEVIIVARAVLGTINHSLLTVEAAQREGLRIAAVVLSKRPTADDAFAQSNADEIQRRVNVPVILMRRPEDLDPLL